MKKSKKRFWTLLTAMLCNMVILLFPLIANATVTAKVNTGWINYNTNTSILDEQLGPPLPISSGVANSFASISSSSNTIYMSATSSSSSAYIDDGESGGAEYWDTSFFSEIPVLEFNYDYSYSVPNYLIGNAGAWMDLRVWDKTDNNKLLYETCVMCTNRIGEFYAIYSSQDSGTISIPVTIGHELIIDWTVVATSYDKQASSYINSSANFGSTTVAPEPISALLFLTGGATLIGRKYIRRRYNKASD